jgi:ribosome-associated protein
MGLRHAPIQWVIKARSQPMKVIEILQEPIELYKILKFENLVSSGGEAKYAISEGRVRVNGEIETRKRKKIVSGDVIEFENERFRVQVK